MNPTTHPQAAKRADRMVAWHATGADIDHRAAREAIIHEPAGFQRQVARVLIGRLLAPTSRWGQHRWPSLPVARTCADLDLDAAGWWMTVAQAVSLLALVRARDWVGVDWLLSHPVEPLGEVVDVLARLAAEGEAR